MRVLYLHLTVEKKHTIIDFSYEHFHCESHFQMSPFWMPPFCQKIQRGGWRKHILPKPEMQASFLHPFSYPPSNQKGHNSGERSFAVFWALLVAKPPPANPFFKRMRLSCLQLEASCLQWSFLLTVDNFSFYLQLNAFVKLSCQRVIFNSVQTRCIVKARLRKVRFSGDFLGVFDFLRIACSLGIPQENL